MKVLCIKGGWNLTTGKWYEVIREDRDNYLIIDDYGNNYWFPKSRFKTQVEVRDEKLKELGI